MADADAAAFMLMAMLGGSTRAVMEMGASTEDLARLRSELPRACYGYLVAATGDAAKFAGSCCAEARRVASDGQAKIGGVS